MIFPQLFIGKQEPSFSLFNDITNTDTVKPSGGLWTSTYKEAIGSEWVQWCFDADEEVPKDGFWQSYLVVPKKDISVFVIDSYQDLERLMEEFGEDMLGVLFHIDFEKMRQKYDAIWLTEQGETLTRHSDPYHLYGWNAETVLWLNWKVETVTSIGVMPFVKRNEF